MSTYTTTLNEVIKDINHRHPKPIPEMIETARPKIFDFEYVTPKNVDTTVFKKWFETTFISKFMLWEIGFDTFEQFKLQLWSKCLQIMPIYSIMIERIVDLQAVDDSAFYDIKKGTINDKDNEKIVNDDETNKNNVHSTLPINMINANSIGSTTYADDGNKDYTKIDKKSTRDRNDTKTYDLKMGNYINSLSTFMDIINNKNLNDIYNNLFNEFNYLFLGVM